MRSRRGAPLVIALTKRIKHVIALTKRIKHVIALTKHIKQVRLKTSLLALKSVKGGERMLSAEQRTTLALLGSHANNVQVMYYCMCAILPYVLIHVCVCPRVRR